MIGMQPQLWNRVHAKLPQHCLENVLLDPVGKFGVLIVEGRQLELRVLEELGKASQH